MAGIALLIIYGSIPAIGLTAVGVNNLLSGYWKKPQMSTYINIGITLFVTIDGAAKRDARQYIVRGGLRSHHPKHPVAARYLL